MTHDVKHKSLSTILVLLAILAGYFLAYPSWQSLSVTRAELKTAEAEQKRLDQAFMQLRNFLTKYESLSDQASIAAKALPSKADSAVLLANIEQLARASGLAIDLLNVTEGREESKQLQNYTLTPLDVQVGVSGSYFAFKDFLLRLQDNLRILDVEHIGITGQEGNSNLVFDIKLKTYYQE